MKIIILLRNPIDRAFSAYMHLIRDGRETLSFEESLSLEEERKGMNYEPMWLYRELGLYSQQVKRFLDVFGPNQVKILLFEEFVRNPVSGVRDVLEFLDVDPDFPIDTSLHINESGQPKSRWLYNFISKPHGMKEIVKPLLPAPLRERIGLRAKSLVLEKVSMHSETRTELKQYFLQDILHLENIIKMDLSIWTRQ